MVRRRLLNDALWGPAGRGARVRPSPTPWRAAIRHLHGASLPATRARCPPHALSPTSVLFLRKGTERRQMVCVCLPSDAYRATCAPARESAATSWASSTASPPPGPHRPAAPTFRRKVVTWYATAPRSGDRCLRPLRGERRYLLHRCAIPPDRPIAIGSVCVCFRGLYGQAQHLRPSRAAGAPLAPQVQTDARSPRPLGRYPCASGANVVTCYTSASRRRRVRLRPVYASASLPATLRPCAPDIARPLGPQVVVFNGIARLPRIPPACHLLPLPLRFRLPYRWSIISGASCSSRRRHKCRVSVR